MALTSVQIQSVRQIGRTAFQVIWRADDDPITMWQINTKTNGGGWLVHLDTLAVEARSIIVPMFLDDGDTLDQVRVDGEPDGITGAWTDGLTWTIPYEDADFTWAPPATDATTIRYTSLADVKQRLHITDTAWDSILTTAIVSAEIALDKWLGRSFPDTGTNPEFPYIPVDVIQAAGNIAVAVARQMDAPFGTAASGDLFGEIDLGDEVRRSLERSPHLRGYRAQWGVS